MPVIFSTPSSHRVFMLDKDADTMFKAMQTSGNTPGALYPEAITAALESLKNRTELGNDTENEQETEDNNHVGLHTKALPLIELMERAIEKNEKLLWEKG